MTKWGEILVEAHGEASLPFRFEKAYPRPHSSLSRRGAIHRVAGAKVEQPHILMTPTVAEQTIRHSQVVSAVLLARQSSQ